MHYHDLKNPLRTLLLWLCACCPLLMLHAQSNKLYTTQNGLETSNIHTLSIDSHGLLWIASNARVAYFDGTEFHYLPNVNPETGRTLYTLVNQVVQADDTHYWILTNNGLYYYDLTTLTHQRVQVSPEESDTRPYSMLRMLPIPGKPHERIILTSGYGIYYFDAQHKKVQVEKTRLLQNALASGYVESGCIDARGRLWAATQDRKLTCIDLQQNRVVPYTLAEGAEAIIATQRITKILEVPSRHAIYMTTTDGMLKYDIRTGQLATLPATMGKPYTTLLCTRNDVLLAGTDSYGVYQLDRQDNYRYFEQEDPVFDLSLGKVRDIVEDKEGNLVFALLQKGIFVQPQQYKAFRYHAISLQEHGKNSSCITSMRLDRQQNYWIATDGAGVFVTNGLSMRSARPRNAGLRSLLVQAVERDAEGRIWIGSYGGGVQYYDAAQARFVTPEWLQYFSESQVLALAVDTLQDVLYAGLNGDGVYALHLREQTYEKVKYDEHQGEWISSLYMDDERTLWIAEVGTVGYIDLAAGKRGQLPQGSLPPNSQCISTMGAGSEKVVLIGTTNGLAFYHKATGQLTWMLEGQTIASINQTAQDIWVAATNCVYAINKKTRKVVCYNSLGGYFLGEFHRSSTLDNGVGNLLFGCDNGIVCFTPSLFNQNRKLPHQIRFTGLRIGDNAVLYSDSTEVLDANILHATRIHLQPDESTFTVRFSVPNFYAAQLIHYEYKLEGYDTNWVSCPRSEDPFATYTNLPAGDYTLHIRAYIEGTEGQVVENSIRVHLEAPWYSTVWAKWIYLFIVIGICYIAYRIWQTRRQQQQALNDALHNEEIKEAKLRLFTSITHELRTPLTMIVSPLKQLLTTARDEQTRNNLNVMQHNCNRLLDIVKQITDIRKIDAGQFRLHFQEVDLCSYTHDIAQSFLGAAAAKHINFSIESSEAALSVWVDPIHFEKIIVNILSNAFKFCPEGGRILIRNHREGDAVEVSIYNSGAHIDEYDLAHIYERFYQSHKGKKHVGSGIGLNLSYELVQLHHGTLSCVNVEPEGVEFSIHLPSGIKHLSAEELEVRPLDEDASEERDQETEIVRQAINTHVEEIHTEATTNEGMVNTEPSRKPTLLLVDDSKDLLEYLRDQLVGDYDITLAFSGNSAWNQVLLSRPDLIITDMKMPDGDGIELCRRIKSNPELDHTPIIMLTGEGNESIQLESLNLQVDHYVQKPFNLDILQGIIRQLLGVRENLKRHIQRKDISNDYEKVELPSMEDQLFERINESVQRHLDDDQFGVQELANEVGISRVHLNRKMKEKYGLSPNVFIKTHRLKQAAYLLLHKRANVSEVAYRVGFATHSYFSSSFRDFFGMTPKDFVTHYSLPENEEKLRKLLE